MHAYYTHIRCPDTSGRRKLPLSTGNPHHAPVLVVTVVGDLVMLQIFVRLSPCFQLVSKINLQLKSITNKRNTEVKQNN